MSNSPTRSQRSFRIDESLYREFLAQLALGGFDRESVIAGLIREWIDRQKKGTALPVLADRLEAVAKKLEGLTDQQTLVVEATAHEIAKAVIEETIRPENIDPPSGSHPCDERCGHKSQHKGHRRQTGT